MDEQTRARLIDVSAWQDLNSTPRGIDFLKMKASGIDGVAIKFGQNNWLDEDAARNWKDAGEAGFPRLAYWFYEYRAWGRPVEEQVDAFVRALAAMPCEMGGAWDVERPNGSWPELPARDVILASLPSVFFKIEVVTNQTGWFYSNPAGLSHLAPIPAWMSAKRLWIAHYLQLNAGETALEAVARVRKMYPTWILPDARLWGTSGWSMWQVTDHENGDTYGVESGNVDFNLFIGTAAELRALARMDDDIPTGGDVPDAPEVDAARAVVVDNGSWLNVRASPSTSAPIIGRKNPGDVVDILNISGSDAWVEIAPGQWVAFRVGTRTYLRME